MQDEHRVHKLHRVDRPVRTAGIVVDDFKDTCTAEALEWLCRVMQVPVSCGLRLRGLLSVSMVFVLFK